MKLSLLLLVLAGLLIALGAWMLLPAAGAIVAGVELAAVGVLAYPVDRAGGGR